MRRREFIAGLSVATMWPATAWTQHPPAKIWRVGILETTSIALNASNFEAFRNSLKNLGYVEGQNLVIEYCSAEGRGERFAELTADLLKTNVDVIVTRGTPAVLAAKKATRTIPIVMAAMGDPLMVVPNLAHPPANITGLSGYTNDLEAKRVEVIKELVPGAVRIAGLYNMGNPVIPAQWDQVQTAAQKLGIKPLLFDIRKPEDIEPALSAASRQHADAIMVGVDALTQQHRTLIAKLAADHRLPTISAGREFIDAGGLIVYGPNYPDLYRRAAIYVDRVLRGASPSELPIEQPTKFELIINLRTARALDIKVPSTLLVSADEVIE